MAQQGEIERREPSDRLPLGVLVVLALAVGRIVIGLAQLFYLDVAGAGGIAWIASASMIPTFEEGTPAWVIGRVAVIVMVLATAASIYGLWHRRPWGWVLALVIAGVVLALDLGWWAIGEPRFLGMFLNMVAVFYLNQRDVRAIYTAGPR